MGLALPSISGATVAHHNLMIECRRERRRWQVTAGDRVVDVPHSVGMEYLARLVGSPGTEMARRRPRRRPPDGARLSPAGARRAGKGDLPQRVTELRGEIDEAEEACDIERAAQARLELEHFLQRARPSHRARRPRSCLFVTTPSAVGRRCRRRSNERWPLSPRSTP